MILQTYLKYCTHLKVTTRKLWSGELNHLTIVEILLIQSGTISSLCFEHLFYLFCQDPECTKIGSTWVLSKGSPMNWTLKNCDFSLFWNKLEFYLTIPLRNLVFFNLKTMGYLQKQCKEQKSCWDPGGSGSLVDLTEVFTLWRNPFLIG